MIIKYHYSHKIVQNSYLHLGVFFKKELMGVLSFGYALNPSSIGRKVFPGLGNNEYMELNRMWLDDALPKCVASCVFSYCIKVIKKLYPAVKIIQSFADARCHKNGLVYMACNFVYYGYHEGDFYVFGDEFIHPIEVNRILKTGERKKEDFVKVYYRQYRFIFYIDKKMRDKCLLKEQNYRDDVGF